MFAMKIFINVLYDHLGVQGRVKFLNVIQNGNIHINSIIQITVLLHSKITQPTNYKCIEKNIKG